MAALEIVPWSEIYNVIKQGPKTILDVIDRNSNHFCSRLASEEYVLGAYLFEEAIVSVQMFDGPKAFGSTLVSKRQLVNDIDRIVTKKISETSTISHRDINKSSVQYFIHPFLIETIAGAIVTHLVETLDYPHLSRFWGSFVCIEMEKSGISLEKQVTVGYTISELEGEALIDLPFVLERGPKYDSNENQVIPIIDEEHLIYVYLQILHTIDFLSKHGIVHLDLHLENIRIFIFSEEDAHMDYEYFGYIFDDGRAYSVANLGYIVRIIDWDITRVDVGNTRYMNRYLQGQFFDVRYSILKFTIMMWERFGLCDNFLGNMMRWIRTTVRLNENEPLLDEQTPDFTPSIWKQWFLESKLDQSAKRNTLIYKTQEF